MHVVEVDDIALVLFPDVLLEIVGVDVFWRTFHEDHEAVFNGWVRCYQDHQCETVGANWIEPPEVWAEIDNCSSSNNAAAHEHVAENMKVGGININVFYLFHLLRRSAFLVVEKRNFDSSILDFRSLRRVFKTIRNVILKSHGLFLVKDFHLNQVKE